MGTERRRPVIGITLDIEGDYLRLNRNYSTAIKGAGGIPLLIPADNDSASVAEIIDGLLIPGGDDLDPSYFYEEPHPSVKITQKDRTGFEISLLKAIMELEKPVLGICYGMQLINVVLGGNLYQDIFSQIEGGIEHRNGNHKVKVTQVFNSVFPNSTKSRGLSRRLPTEGAQASGIPHSAFVVNSFHHQAVRELGKGLEVCAFAEDNIVEAVFMPAYPFLAGIQWHPERMEGGVSGEILRTFVESAYAFRSSKYSG